MDAAAREALGRLVGGADTELLGDARRVRELLQVGWGLESWAGWRPN